MTMANCYQSYNINNIDGSYLENSIAAAKFICPFESIRTKKYGNSKSTNKEHMPIDVQIKKLRQVDEFLKAGSYPYEIGRTEKVALKRLSQQFKIIEGALYFLPDDKCNPLLVVFEESQKRIGFEKSHIDNEIHLDFKQTLTIAVKVYYWPGMVKDIKEMIKDCSCEDKTPDDPIPEDSTKTNIRMYSTPVMPIQATGPWQVLMIDISGPFPKTVRGNLYICCLCDLYSNWISAFAIRDKSACVVSEVLTELFYSHGYPKQVWNNVGKVFTKLLAEEINVIGPELSVVYVDKSKFVTREELPWRKYIQSLHQYFHDDHVDWDICLPSTIYPHNVSSINNVSPYVYMYDRLPRDITSLNIEISPDTNAVFAILNFMPSYNHVPEVFGIDEDLDTKPASQRDTNQRLHQLLEFMKNCTYPEGWKRAEKYALRKFAKRFKLVDGKLFYLDPLRSNKKRIVLFTDKDRKMAVNECHIDSVTNAHHGFIRTQKKINDKYYWMEITKDVCDMVKQCPHCTKGSNDNAQLPTESLQAIQAREAFEYMAVDVLGPFNTTANGNGYIISITDIYTKWVAMFPLCIKSPKAMSNVIAQLIYTYGSPKRFFCGQGRTFVTTVNQELFHLIGIKYAIAPGYNTQYGNQEKTLNRPLKQGLQVFTNDNKDDWDIHIKALGYRINTAREEGTSYLPYFLMYGRVPKNEELLDNRSNNIINCNQSSDITNSLPRDWDHEKQEPESMDISANNVTKRINNDGLEYTDDTNKVETAEEMLQNNGESPVNNMKILEKYICNNSSDIENKIIKKIYNLTSQGITGVKKVQILLKNYIRQETSKFSKESLISSEKFIDTYSSIKFHVEKARLELKKEGRNYIKLQTKSAIKELLKEIDETTDEKKLLELKEHILHLKNALQNGTSLQPLLMQRKHQQEESQENNFRIKRKKTSHNLKNVPPEIEDPTNLSLLSQTTMNQLNATSDTPPAVQNAILYNHHPESVPPLQQLHHHDPHQYEPLLHINQAPPPSNSEIYYIMPDNCS